MTIDVQSAEEVAQAWSKVDFEHLQRNLNDEVQAIDARENESKIARQQLIAESKNYYEHANKESRKSVTPLIKAFQTEYDRATERAKAAETRLILICRTFTTVSDPSPYLEQIPSLLREVERLRSVDEQAGLLRRQLNEMEEEFGDLQNQELTVRQLREQVKQMETEAHSNVQAVINEKEKELRAEMEAFEKEMMNKQDELTADNKKLSNAVADMETKSKETNRILEETKLQLAKRETVNDEKLEIVTNDLESALQRAVEAEREIQRLQNELAKISRHSSTSPNGDGILEDNPLIRSKDNQIRKLLEENKMLNAKLTDLRAETNKRIDELTQQLENHVELVTQLRAQLEAQSDYEDIKKELRILRSIEFGDDGNVQEESRENDNFRSNGVTTTATATAEVQLAGHSAALDELLVGKNRKLQSENVELRMRNQKLEGKRVLDEGEEQPSTAMIMDSSKELTDILGLTNSTDCTDSLANLFANRSKQKSAAESSGDLYLQSDSHPAANILKLLMSASSSNDIPKVENFNSTSSFNLHELSRSPGEERIYSQLQDILASNIQNLGSKALNTTEIAKQCKRLMVTHNIGQRLFAKYVMNQVVKSQGSLSELLSKPRHWNKLTDKGREAFRRMYAWVSDQKAIELLCAISPRRNQPLGSIEIEAPSPRTLWDENEVSLAAVSRYTDDTYTPGLFASKQPLRATTGDVTSASKHHVKLSAVVGSGGGGTNASSGVQRTSRWRHDDIPKEKIMKIYKRELARLREQESHLEQAMSARPSSAKIRDEKLSTSAVDMTGKQSSSLSSSSSVCGSSCDASSPTQPSFPVNSAQALFALKCRNGMSPITQEQLERYVVLDTDDIVRQIKDLLCSNSISQRQFGEHVLGLSQGSVSDLLARPKPWAMLTQKGREPFIRMQLFLNEARSIGCKTETSDGKFDATQFSEDMPLKNEVINDGDDDAKQNASDAFPELNNLSNSFSDEMDEMILPESRTEIRKKIKKEPMLNVDGGEEKMRKKTLVMADTSEIALLVRHRLQTNGISQKTFGDVILGVSPGGVSELLSKPKAWDQLSPRGRELYLKMSEWLRMESNGIRLLQEAACPANATAAAATASLPPTISATLTNVMEKLHSTTIESYGRGAATMTKNLSATKRKASSSAVSATAAPTGGLPKKAQRTVISDQQKEALKMVFENDQHPNQQTIERLSQKLLLSTRTVSNWFHNYRTRQKASLRAKNLATGKGDSNDQKWVPAKEKSSNDRIKQDLDELRKLNLKSNHWSPTMVPSSYNSSTNRLTKPVGNKEDSPLNKAIERIQKLNAAKHSGV